MTQPTIAPNIDQAPDVLLHLAAQITLDPMLTVDYLAQRGDLSLRQVLDPRIWAHAGLFEDLATRGLPNPIDICQSNLYPLTPR
jgi:hypothetical protein